MLRHVVRAVCFVVALNAAPALAQDVKITEAMVRAFSAEQIASFKLPLDAYIALVKKSYHTDFQGTAAITTSGPGIPPTSSSDISNYQTTVDNAEIAYQAMQGGTMEHTIKNINIAADGKSAITTDDMDIRQVKMPAPLDNMYLNMKALCENELALSPEGFIQIVKATCSIESTLIATREL